MLKVILAKGIPASSKSTWAKALMAEEPGKWKRINFDELRETFDAGKYSKENEEMIKKVRDLAVKECLLQGLNCVIDNTNIKDKGRNFKHICNLVRQMNIDVVVEEKPFFVGLYEAIARDAARPKPVGEQVIKEMFDASGGNKFQFYVGQVKEFSKREMKVVQDKNLPKAVIFDLDGTCCDISHRSSPYAAEQCLNDSPHEHTINIANMYFEKGYHIIFCSGREQKFEELTREWLNKFIPFKHYDLFMRPVGNTEKDYVVKENIFNECIKDKYYVEAVFDDRKQMKSLWWRLGLNIFGVGDPDSDF